MKTDIRWLQRLDNLEKALGNLEVALAIEEADMAQRVGGSKSDLAYLQRNHRQAG